MKKIVVVIILIFLSSMLFGLYVKNKEKKVLTVLILPEKKLDYMEILVAPVNYVNMYGKNSKVEPIPGLNINLKIIDPKGKEYILNLIENKTLPLESVNFRSAVEMLKKGNNLFRYHANFYQIESIGTYIVLVNIKDVEQKEFFVIERPSKILLNILDIKTRELSSLEKSRLKNTDEFLERIGNIFLSNKSSELDLDKINGVVMLTLNLETNDGALPYEVTIQSEMDTPEGRSISFSKKFSYNEIKNNHGRVYFYHPVFTYGEYTITLKATGSYGNYYESSDFVSIDFEFS